jgi:hypothetical protein
MAAASAEPRPNAAPRRDPATSRARASSWFYTTDVDQLFQHYGVLASRLGAAGVAPTTTMLGVTRLAIPELMVELEGTAVA